MGGAPIAGFELRVSNDRVIVPVNAGAPQWMVTGVIGSAKTANAAGITATQKKRQDHVAMRRILYLQANL
jgi:hypothetical protein